MEKLFFALALFALSASAALGACLGEDVATEDAPV